MFSLGIWDTPEVSFFRSTMLIMNLNNSFTNIYYFLPITSESSTVIYMSIDIYRVSQSRFIVVSTQNTEFILLLFVNHYIISIWTAVNLLSPQPVCKSIIIYIMQTSIYLSTFITWTHIRQYLYTPNTNTHMSMSTMVAIISDSLTEVPN